MAQWKTICKVEDIPLMGARRVARKQGAEIAIFRTQNNKVFALLDKCPH
ncbi:MAG: nitrite reductase, partial [Pseudomonadota bacterium]